MIPMKIAPKSLGRLRRNTPLRGVGDIAKQLKTRTDMFNTIYCVKYIKGYLSSHQETIFTAYFEDYDDALAFVHMKRQALKTKFIHSKATHFDGSFEEEWTSTDLCLEHSFFLNDSAWVTDWPNGSINFHDEKGLVTNFETEDAFKEYINDSHARL